jgi:hypothetical protein
MKEAIGTAFAGLVFLMAAITLAAFRRSFVEWISRGGLWHVARTKEDARRKFWSGVVIDLFGALLCFVTAAIIAAQAGDGAGGDSLPVRVSQLHPRPPSLQLVAGQESESLPPDARHKHNALNGQSQTDEQRERLRNRRSSRGKGVYANVDANPCADRGYPGTHH